MLPPAASARCTATASRVSAGDARPRVTAEGQTVTRDHLSARLVGPMPAHTPQGGRKPTGSADHGTGAGSPASGACGLHARRHVDLLAP